MKKRSKALFSIVLLTFLILIIKFLWNSEVINLNEPIYFLVGGILGVVISNSKDSK